MIWAKPVNIEQ